MDTTKPPTPDPVQVLDEDKYREEVLQITAETEQARAQALSSQAVELGLKVPEIIASAPLAASLANGLVDLSSPAVSSGSSQTTNRNSTCDSSVTPSRSLEPSSPPPLPLDQATSSLSQLALGSAREKPGSTRSLVSWSTRPTSFCSSESRAINAGLGLSEGMNTKGNRNSMFVVPPAAEKVLEKERRRSSLKSAIGRIHFRKWRAPSAAVLPAHARVTVSRDGEGDDHLFLEKQREPPTSHAPYPSSIATTESIPKVEVPMFDHEALKRSLEDAELSEMLGRHRMEKSRHMAFQDAALNMLRRRHQTAVTEAQAENQRLEDEKREKVSSLYSPSVIFVANDNRTIPMQFSSKSASWQWK